MAHHDASPYNEVSQSGDAVTNTAASSASGESTSSIVFDSEQANWGAGGHGWFKFHQHGTGYVDYRR